MLIKSFASQSSNIRTAKFLENFMWSENYIRTLFKNKADSDLKENLFCSLCRYNFRARKLVWNVTIIMCFFAFLSSYGSYFIFASCSAAASGE